MVKLHLAPLFHDHSSFVLCVLNRNFLPQKRLQMSCQNVFCTVIVMMKIEAAFRVNIMLADSANPGLAALNYVVVQGRSFFHPKTISKVKSVLEDRYRFFRGKTPLYSQKYSSYNNW